MAALLKVKSEVPCYHTNILPWSSLVVGDEGCIGLAESCSVYVKPQKLCNTCNAKFLSCLAVGPIQLLISFY